MTEQTTAPATTETQTTEQTQVANPNVTTEAVATDTATTTPVEQTAEKSEPPAVPESADAYEIAIDGFDASAFKSENPDVFAKFHEHGFTNDQAKAAIQLWDDYQQVNMESLQGEWGDDFNLNVNLAKQGIEALGFKASDMDSPTGAIKLAAAIGKYIQEDMPPSNTQQTAGGDIESLMLSEAYSDANHPDHKSVAARVSQYFKKQYPDN
ncbi:hypothetical protein HYG93_02345 [Acinetobacter sp. SwsAc6]|uniref:hypothetical protein n=1 Tax=Acinetobacter sp. SwsAc6 TaxID=2749439 RepID=UPI0015BF4D05|nr:hypothetical protein [Acinetobacter sp. SwsAc6]NWK73142.1 hypothetical protein [Acinetobacter sp. SwsAc6]